jgi:radical SAM protein with 4Fe4S-binding SPASM domain
MERLADAGFAASSLGRRDAPQRRQLDAFKAIADRYGAQLRHHAPAALGSRRGRVGRAAPDRRRSSASSTTGCSRHGEDVLTGDSFFHLAAYGQSLPGLNLCGAGRVVCLIDPVGDVYACPFAIHDAFLAGNVREPAGFAGVWRDSELVPGAAPPQTGGACARVLALRRCRGGCMAAKFFTGLPLDGPDPECVLGHGERLLSGRDAVAVIPRSSVDHSRRRLPTAPATRIRWPTSGAPMASSLTGSSPSRRRSGARSAGCRATSTRRSSPAPSGARRCADNVDAFGELGFIPRIASGCRGARMTTHGHGPADLHAGDDLADGVQAVSPGGEVAVARAAAEAGHRDGAQHPSRASRSRTVVAANRGRSPDLLLGSRERIEQSGWTRARCRRAVRADRDAGTGRSAHRRLTGAARRSRSGSTSRPCAARARRRDPAALAARLGAERRDPSLRCRTHGRPAASATFFGAYGEWIGNAAAHLGRHSLAPRDVGWPVDGQGRHARRGCRRAVDAGATAISVVQPRGQKQPSTAPASIRALAGDRGGGGRPRSRSASTAASAVAATS